MKNINVAIDGFSACGKSTLAKDLAAYARYTFIDTGAMYRATAFFAISQLHCPTENGILILDNCKNTIVEHLKEVNIEFALSDNGQRIKLNGTDIEDEIRTSEMGQNASIIATVKEVRQYLVHLQQLFGRNKRVIMDGRDIGTVVFPDAELKLFITADFEVRTLRRYKQLFGTEQIDKVKYDEVKAALAERDYRDTHRDESPLVQAEDAIVLDNSLLDRQQQLDKVITIFKQRTDEESNS